MPFNNEIRAGASGAQSTEFYSHTIDQSLRIDNPSGAYLTMSQASPTATNRKKVAISCWVKRSAVSVSGVCTVFWASSAGLMLQFFAADTIYIYDNNAGGYQAYVQPTSGVSRVFRDTGGWYHLALIIDTTQSTAADRSKFYVNGTLNAQNSYPSENSDITWHTGSTMRIGSVGDSQDLNGYIAEFISIDGQDVSISDFGETKDGVWVPKDVSGLTLGNAGFYLPFSQTKDAGFSALFDTRDTSKIVYSDSSSFDIANDDDFTIEFFFNTPDVDSTYGNWMGQYATAGPHHLISYDFRNSSTRIIYWYTGNGAAFQWNVSPTTAIVGGKWHHLAFQRDGTILRAYLDGTRLDTVVDAASNTGYTLSDGKSTNFNKSYNLGQITIGDPHGQGYKGYISNVRYVIGNTIYADDDNDITVPTATLTAVTGTKLLTCHNGTVGDDASSENNDGTVTSTTASTVNPFGTFNFFQDVGSNAINFDPTNINDIDVLPDSPTNNFSIMNDLFPGNSAVILEGGLEVEPGGFSSSLYGTVSTFAIPKDKKIYIEAQCNDQQGNYWTAGFATLASLNNGPGSSNIGSDGAIMAYNRSVQVNGTETDYGASYGLGGLGSGVTKLSAGDVLGCMIDGATGKVWFSRNGTYFLSPSTDNSGTTGDPDGGNHEIGTLTGGTTDDVFFVISGDAAANEILVNFGQDSQSVSTANADANSIGTFEYAPPSNYVSLCASNLTTPDIGPTKSQQADDNFNTVLYTGDGTTNRSITGVGFTPDWIWGKSRSNAEDHFLHDTVRGAGKKLESNNTGAEDTTATAVISAFESDGFTGPSSTPGNINVSSRTYVTWNWKAGTSVSGTTTGSGTGQAYAGSVNTDAGFSIIAYTGNGTAGHTIPHHLGVAPKMVISKKRSSTGSWGTYHADLTSASYYILLNDTAAQASNTVYFNGTAPTDSVVTRGTGADGNANGVTYIQYSFAEIEGYSKVGRYKGNNNANGPHVNTGFRPAWLMLKRIDSAASWLIYDKERDFFNQMQFPLFPNVNNVEYTSNILHVDFLSNGFKIRNATYGETNAAGNYIYLCFADQPFKFSNAR